MFTRFFRGIVYGIVLVLFSPILAPSAVLGLIFAALRVGFSIGSNLLVHFLLTFKIKKEDGLDLPPGIKFSRQHPKGSRR